MNVRVFFASDLHVDVASGAAATARLAEYLVEEGTSDDVLLLGGDYGNDDEAVAECLEMFAEFSGHRLAISGNHDVWVDVATMDSMTRYQGLSDLYRSFGFHPLEEEPVVIDGIGFAGAMGWYDYTFRVPELEVPLEVYERKGFPGLSGPVWNDGRNVNWDRTDPEFTAWQLQRLRAQLEALDEAESIVVATHHVPTEGLLRPGPLPSSVPRRLVVPRKWLILNTYLGSARFEELLVEYAARIDVALCGHIHLARTARRGGVRFVSNGSDHKQKELVLLRDGRVARSSFGPRG